MKGLSYFVVETEVSDKNTFIWENYSDFFGLIEKFS